VVGFVGAFRPEKGIEYFLEMAKLLLEKDPTVRFLAVGGESSVRDVGFLPRMKDYADELGLADVVVFTGKREDIPDLMKSMDVLVLPSLREGFGRVILEANAAGRPVVGADAAGIPEVIEPGITGHLVPPRDPVRMAEVVMGILADHGWRAQVAAEVPERVAARFAPERQVAALEGVWSRVLSGKQPRSAET
jgi:glycosyltransferase involved in cell wall biosynthesis